MTVTKCDQLTTPTVICHSRNLDKNKTQIEKRIEMENLHQNQFVTDTKVHGKRREKRNPKHQMEQIHCKWSAASRIPNS